ncbi:MAG: hypothetical protein LBE78_07020 [Burkholderiaceae bacterium]|nr:hypothetical protein [Burkholderiaceae bacterium]
MSAFAMANNSKNRYFQLIEDIFFNRYKKGDVRVEFIREDIEDAAVQLNIKLPKNLGDIIYSFKFRTALPEKIKKTADDGKEWVIKNIGRAQYAFEQLTNSRILPDDMLMATKIPDATPGIVERYALEDEQSLLAKLRYNRLLDIFTGVTCYSLQNHLRTTVPGVGQVETDEIYVGVDKLGRQYVFPVQAKGGKDEIGIVQIEQDILLCSHKYPSLICRAIAAQFLGSNRIVIFEFTVQDGEIRKKTERHYHLVLQSEITSEELAAYNQLVD